MGAAELEFHERVKFETQSCANCGVRFAMTADLVARRRETGATFWCPNGHTLVFKSEIERLKKELDNERQRRDIALREAAAERKLREQADAEAKRLRVRAANGVCPCCKRSFQNLRRHMGTKHPGYAAAPKEEGT